jgi:hypothetical protein
MPETRYLVSQTLIFSNKMSRVIDSFFPKQSNYHFLYMVERMGIKPTTQTLQVFVAILVHALPYLLCCTTINYTTPHHSNATWQRTLNPPLHNKKWWTNGDSHPILQCRSWLWRFTL